jgi:hypothetical protein
MAELSLAMFQAKMVNRQPIGKFILIYLRFISLRTARANAKQSEGLKLGLILFCNAAAFFRLKKGGSENAIWLKNN